MISLSIYLGMVGPWQIAIIVALVLLMFGGKKIPELMKGLGGGIKEFKKATKEESEEKLEEKK
ncbi:sec-independent protein translocase protein TatA [Polaribacter sp. Hel1_33_78]|jgi:sec-independent protein translocase protein TatA|nr:MULTISPECIES: twin-arginine translocase TatA/TatE family subunit [unclassified Polaribacter]MBT3741707.1 twin-arginine translocase TatA/TatE family subunit [Polaribacter sp.]MBT4413352.1 twin-arginine translocase TatA/TatE family subunit [Polaribacter sp.]MBT7815436.1 twin-arginine translocase TatA/TatE family subunit [Polaribacter sp.]MDG1196237.1 twin-arginine translocase TatA/TatE family subunit [Polaribacter sp.]MDG1403931.1 twin-arginine translocase TatA/TatE family subunit [Polaribact